MAVGVLAGAKKPVIDTASYPGTVSAIGGRPGARAEGRLLLTPSALNLPALTCAAAEVAEILGYHPDDPNGADAIEAELCDRRREARGRNFEDDPSGMEDFYQEQD